MPRNARSAIEGICPITQAHVERQQRSLLEAGRLFHRQHQAATDAPPLYVRVDEQLGDFGAVPGVGPRRQVELDRTNNPASLLGYQEPHVRHAMDGVLDKSCYIMHSIRVPERSNNQERSYDINTPGSRVVGDAIGDIPKSSKPEKNPHAATLGRLGARRAGLPVPRD